MTYAIFAATETEARALVAQWTGAVRKDWTVESSEVVRNAEDVAFFGPWTCQGAVAPACRATVPEVPARKFVAKARGPFARWGDDDRGVATSTLEVVFPA
jgi:hypothetical protein